MYTETIETGALLLEKKKHFERLLEEFKKSEDFYVGWKVRNRNDLEKLRTIKLDEESNSKQYWFNNEFTEDVLFVQTFIEAKIVRAIQKINEQIANLKDVNPNGAMMSPGSKMNKKKDDDDY